MTLSQPQNGHPTSVQPLIDAIDQADSPDRLVAAVQALVAAQQEAGIPTLIRALGFNNPGAAAIAVRGLVQLGKAAVQPLLDLVDDYNYGARAWTIRALVGIGDPRALEELLAAAEADFAPSVRRAATKGLGDLHWDWLPEGDAAQAQERVMTSLVKISQDTDWSLRYAAIGALEALALSANPLRSTIEQQLQQIAHQDEDLAVQSRSQKALQALTAT
ncbi:HEAT repeat domain-containing protein [Leptolyngbya ohadii]|uniref:HEAT repeat domain-containing protein n=1 Tax=Leptolyngbya ohadii TaxID=1962290 RepID=UPI000B5A0F60|nr:HEAT repeat domain-containing protein [Leptolyngbya ohadii]